MYKKNLWIHLIWTQYEVSDKKPSWIVNLPFMYPPSSFSYWSFQKHVLYWISHGILFKSPYIRNIKKGECFRNLFLAAQKVLKNSRQLINFIGIVQPSVRNDIHTTYQYICYYLYQLIQDNITSLLQNQLNKTKYNNVRFQAKLS